MQKGVWFSISSSHCTATNKSQTPTVTAVCSHRRELYVKNCGRESKVYICLFTCAAIRAVHLEVVNDLSVGTFLLAVRRFASRQSLPDIIISNNVTTYQSAAAKLKLLFQSPTLKQELCRQGTCWIFIPK